ncbi:uncharacterized protein [Blastocystis hominis]|uniref:Protein kinase domain-containing protein n=1 Tax=Blastocystis hominis TaxID=12968 RepID=D8M7W8_BLAHO|nr:uncharacterized protein [Blastocystis hominis]CBK24157.2 unnamed protein product [Blastocystis hominis]|eukprot:XP_012898205.1 uncharacterized protein [Blastocystis hominis]
MPSDTPEEQAIGEYQRLELLSRDRDTLIFKAFSTSDGKELIWKELNVSRWTQSNRYCFMNALKMVEEFQPVDCILKCFAHKYDPKQQKVIYITESISDNVMNALRPVGMVYLQVIRKWVRCLLMALSYLHYEAPFSPLIHGHLQFPISLPACSLDAIMCFSFEEMAL